MSALTATNGLHPSTAVSGAPALAEDTKCAQGAHPEYYPVQSNADLAAVLADLAHYLDDPDLNLAETFRQLAEDTKLAVDSYLGLSVGITTDGHQLTLTAFDASAKPESIRTSLMLRLTAVATEKSDASSALSVILYAARPGAFVDLAADLDWMSGLQSSTGLLDKHLPFSPAEVEHQGLHALSTVNQAIGALIGSGHTPERAHRELDALALRAGTDRVTAALQFLEGLDDRS